MEQRKNRKGSMEPDKNPGGKVKKEQGAQKKWKKSREKHEKGARGKQLKGVWRKLHSC